MTLHDMRVSSKQVSVLTSYHNLQMGSLFSNGVSLSFLVGEVLL